MIDLDKIINTDHSIFEEIISMSITGQLKHIDSITLSETLYYLIMTAPKNLYVLTSPITKHHRAIEVTQNELSRRDYIQRNR